MRVTTRSEYALLALIYLARHQSEAGFVPLSRVAREQGIPLKYLEQLALAMQRAGFLESRKGQHGGYSLARPADTIVLADVFRLLDGALAPTGSASKYFYRHTPLEREAKLLGLMKEVRNLVATKLEAKTLADIV